MAAIDVVLLWVDGSDPAWLAEKNAYLSETKGFYAATDASRFRDWDNLKYVFRGFDKYMSWVRKIHFVTWGHLPEWLDVTHPKLNIVKHSDFIPSAYLPTFNSHTIELNLHRIKGLSEQFIYFNDDIFTIAKTMPEDFFQAGLPCDIAALKPYNVAPGGIAPIVMNNLEVINQYFDKTDIFKHKKKWFNYKYGKFMLSTLFMLQFDRINGIYEPHALHALKKSTFETIWRLEYELLERTCQSKFRDKHHVNIWLLRDWQLMTGQFVPRRPSFSSYRTIPEHFEAIQAILQQPKPYKVLCINDSVRNTDFDYYKEQVNQSLAQLLPEKSAYEL